MVYAKHARGMMVSFIIKNKIKDTKDIKLFTNDGYAFSEKNKGEILFVR